MSDRKTVTALSKQHVRIEPFSVHAIDFIDSKPNYFRVQNSGANTVYCSPSTIPTANNYDFMVRGGGLSTFADPHPKSKLYIYNPSGTAVNCVVVSFYADFDPIVMALGQIEIEVPETIGTTQIISGFNAELPEGSNRIGSVSVDNQKDYTAKLDEVIAALGSISIGTKKVITAFGSGSSDSEVSAPAGYYISEIDFLSNDSESDLSLSHTDGNGNITNMIVKGGEVLTDIQTWASKLSISGSSFRYCVAYTEE